MTADGKVEVKGQFAAVVVLEEDEFRKVIITLLAERLCQAVTMACKRLTPFFAPQVYLSGGSL